MWYDNIMARHGNGKERMTMAGFVPKEKMSKKAQKAINRRRRVTWEFSPVTKTVASRKVYSRKRKVRNQEDDGSGFSFFPTAEKCGNERPWGRTTQGGENMV